MRTLLLSVLTFLLGYHGWLFVQQTASQHATSETIEWLVNVNNPLSPVVLLKMSDGGRCSGVVVGPKHALTASHCFSDISKINYKLFNKRIKVGVQSIERPDEEIEAEVIAYTDSRDLAIIRGDFRQFQSVEVDLSGRFLPKMIDEPSQFLACGFPWGGQVHCVAPQYVGNYGFWLAFMGAGIYPGMSGGLMVRVIPQVSINPLNKQLEVQNRYVLVGILVMVAGQYTLASPVLSVNQFLQVAQ